MHRDVLFAFFAALFFCAFGVPAFAESLQPEAIGAVMEVTKWLKPSTSVSQIGDSASVQTATRVY
jgi:hypothetical protein